MGFWTDFELLVKIVALVDITLYGFCSLIVGLFMVFLVFVPEKISKIVAVYPNEHREMEYFLDYPVGIQITFALFLWIFWVAMLALAILLLRWSKQRYAPGLSIWLGINVVLAIVCLPLDLKWMSWSGFTVDSVAICVLSYLYGIFSIWVVVSLRQVIVTREGELPQTVEFKAL